MKTLVVYFSKTGNTRKVASKIARHLDADIDEIIDTKKRGEDAVMKNDIEIGFKKDPSKYDMAIIGTPVWGFNITPFAKEYLIRNSFKEVAFFSTYMITTGFLFPKMKRYSKAKPKAKLKIKAKALDVSDQKIKEFCEKIRKAP